MSKAQEIENIIDRLQTAKDYAEKAVDNAGIALNEAREAEIYAIEAKDHIDTAIEELHEEINNVENSTEKSSK